MTEHKDKISSPVVFFGMTFLFTWACWIAAGILSGGQRAWLATLLHYAGGAMPLVVTLMLLFLRGSARQRREYWQRLIDFRRIGKAWYAVILLSVPALTAIAIVIDVLLGGTGAKLEAASSVLSNPLSIFPFAFFILIFGPLPEEMAWRGYALDGLQARWSALSASLALGAAWTLWHLPLFWIEGSYQHGLGWATPAFWLFMLDKVPQTIWMTWIYNNNRRSTLTAVLFHFMVNFTGELLALSPRADALFVVFWWVAAVLVVVVWKPQRLMGIKSGNCE